MQKIIKEPLLEPILRKVRFSKILNNITPNSTVVDVGCGHTPHLLNRLEKYIKSGIGIDPLIEGKSKGKIRLMSYLLSQKIPLKKNYAHHVTLCAVLEHLDNPNEILTEAYRILKPGGTLLLTTPTHANKPLLEFLSFRLGIVSKREILEHKRYFWKKELVDLLKNAGFREIQHEYFELYLNNFVLAKK